MGAGEQIVQVFDLVDRLDKIGRAVNVPLKSQMLSHTRQSISLTFPGVV